MVLVEHFESRQEWWKVADPDASVAVILKDATLNIAAISVNASGSLAISPARWPAIRDAIDALHKVWLDECQS